VRNGLDAASVAFVHDPRLVRGLDYYTRTTFEFVSEALAQAQAALGGGGRYDGLAEVLGGAPTPGIGFALGLDRILMALREEGATLPGEVGIACFVVSIGDQASRVGARLVGDLRDAGIPAAAAFEERPLKAQLKMADRSGAAYAVILGEREVATGTATMKSLGDGDQEEVPIDDVVNWLSRTDWAAER
jgi:histidyl-tRNA synthetase